MRCTHAAGQPDDSSQRGDAMRPSSSFCIMLRYRSGYACSRVAAFCPMLVFGLEGLNWIDESVHFINPLLPYVAPWCFKLL
jgi:hypothetical protein